MKTKEDNKYKIFSIEDNDEDRLAIMQDFKQLKLQDNKIRPDISTEYIIEFFNFGNIKNEILIQTIIKDIEKFHPHLILCDLAWTKSDEDFFSLTQTKEFIEEPMVFKLLEKLDKSNIFIPVIILTNFSENIEDIFIRKFGMRSDHIIISKPDGRNLNQFFKQVKKSIHSQIFIEKVNRLLHQKNYPSTINAKSSSKEINFYNELWIASKRKNQPILLKGETGTGKSFFAETIYLFSNRPNNKYLRYDLSKKTDTLINTELFGYVPGMFTDGLKAGVIGELEEHNGGTVFFDEITECPINVQNKLLELLDSSKFEKQGGKKKIKVDIQFIFATNKDIPKLIAKGKFKHDLYERIASGSSEITTIPLREIKDSLINIASNFRNYYCKKYNINKDVVSLTREDKKSIVNYDWPGNMRELISVIEKHVELKSFMEITSISNIIENRKKNSYNKKDNVILTNDEFFKEFANELFNRIVKDNLNFKTIIKTIECNVLEFAKRKANNNMSEAGKLIGLPEKNRFANKYKQC